MAQSTGHPAQPSPGGLTPLAQPPAAKTRSMQNAKATLHEGDPRPHPLNHKNNTGSALPYIRHKPQKAHRLVFMHSSGERRAQGWVSEAAHSPSPAAGGGHRGGPPSADWAPGARGRSGHRARGLPAPRPGLFPPFSQISLPDPNPEPVGDPEAGKCVICAAYLALLGPGPSPWPLCPQ